MLDFHGRSYDQLALIAEGNGQDPLQGNSSTKQVKFLTYKQAVSDHVFSEPIVTNINNANAAMNAVRKRHGCDSIFFIE
jgi:hypothetical protein